MELEKAGRVADFLEFGEMMCYDARDREESCGGHFRTEHQFTEADPEVQSGSTQSGEAKRHDDKFSHVSCWEYTRASQGRQARPVLHKEPLVPRAIRISEPVKASIRSYALANGFYAGEDCSLLDLPAALMQNGKAFATGPLGKPLIQGPYAFHIENHQLVSYLERVAAANGVILHDDTFETAVTEGDEVRELVFKSGLRKSADLIIDASGFRAELIHKTLGEPFKDFSTGLFCDRAVIGGWTRTDEPLEAYTTAETMDCGWCWQIEHENWINRGYVYSSAFISDGDALKEFLTKNPKVSNNPRVVPFRSGRYERSWVGNVVAIGNASGFVEPLEATALAQLIFEVRWLIEKLRMVKFKPDETTKADYNLIIGRAWDEIRDFLAFHYKFNTRLDTPFWRHCREKTSLGDFEDFYQAYRRLGPSPKTIDALPYKPNIYGIEGYLWKLTTPRQPREIRAEARS
jgi:tryptophan 7-halogenase